MNQERLNMQRAVSGLLTELEKIKNLSDLAIQQKEYGDSLAHKLAEFLNSCEKFNTLYAPESIIETIGKGNNSLKETIGELQAKISDLGISQSTLQNDLTNLSSETSTAVMALDTKLDSLQRCCSDMATAIENKGTKSMKRLNILIVLAALNLLAILSLIVVLVL